jgi:hypothetical protein
VSACTSQLFPTNDCLPGRPSSQAVPSSSRQDSILQKRKDWISRAPDRPPSELGKPKEFASAQKDKLFYFGRPPKAAATIPITLYHDVFGQFQEDCRTYEPTEADHTFVRDFSTSMSKFYTLEVERADSALRKMRKYGLDFSAERIGKYITDGHMRWGDLCYALIEFKLEIGSTGAEPLFQAGWYYTNLAKTTSALVKNLNSILPCFILYTAGSVPISSTGP